MGGSLLLEISPADGVADNNLPVMANNGSFSKGALDTILVTKCLQDTGRLATFFGPHTVALTRFCH